MPKQPKPTKVTQKPTYATQAYVQQKPTKVTQKTYATQAYVQPRAQPIAQPRQTMMRMRPAYRPPPAFTPR